jgi:ubiquinone/menaquinone biosynthesis C-methylase UbiE
MQPVVAVLTDRQSRELEYHRSHAGDYAKLAFDPLDMDLITSPKRRWWNHYWSMYTIFQTMNLKGKSILVDGCGFGNDALSIAVLATGGYVHGNDLSPESVDIARQRAKNLGLDNIQFDVAPCETLPYADNSFDMLLLFDILHHVDIPAALQEAQRVLKPGGKIIIGEPYTHAMTQKIVRNNMIVEKLVYPLMKKFIYQIDKPYITEDERKINQTEMDHIRSKIVIEKFEYSYIFLTRLVPYRFAGFAKFDKMLCRAIGSLGRYAAARFFVMGTFRQA